MQKQRVLKLKNKVNISVTRWKMHWIDLLMIIIVGGLIWARIISIWFAIAILFFLPFAFQKHKTELEELK